VRYCVVNDREEEEKEEEGLILSRTVYALGLMAATTNKSIN